MAERLVEIVAQAGIAIAEIAAANREVALGEVFESGADRGDDAGLQFGLVALHVEVLLALAVEFLLLALLAFFHRMALAHLLLQGFGGAGHQAHFVRHARVRDLEIDILVGNGVQRVADIAERSGNVADDNQCKDGGKHKDAGSDADGLHDVRADLGFEVIDIDAGNENQLPGFESERIGALAEILALFAGLGPKEVCSAAAGTGELNQLVAIHEALAVGLALEILAETLGVRMQAHRHVIVIGIEITVRLEGHGGDSCEGLFLGVLARQLAGRFTLLEFLQNADAGFHLAAQHSVTLCIDRAGGCAQFEIGTDREGDH
ncbi:hypothetical protein D3C73_750640 [compost metagenome]